MTSAPPTPVRPVPTRGRRASRVALALSVAAAAALGGCGVVALPFRAAGDVIEAVPVIGKPIGAPVHAVGDVID